MKTPKRVVHMTTVHHPTDPRIYHKQCKSIANAGYDLYYVAKADDTIQSNELVKHIPIKNHSNRIKRLLFGSFEAYREAKKLKADVYHFHDPELIFIGWLLKRKDNIVIYDIHEDYITSILQKDYMNKIFRNVFAKAYTFFERIFTRKMELCLAEKYYYDIYNRGKLILNYPTINRTFIEHERKGKPLTNELLYTGNVTVDRGALIHAKIPQIDEQVSVHFIGRCPGDLADEMYATANKAKDRLYIEGVDRFVEKEDIEQKYMSRNWLAGLALFPPTDHYMKKELTKFFEYMNAGLPIICSNFPVWEQFIQTYECGIAVDPYNEEEIKEAIIYLRNNPEQAQLMGENGKKAVLEHLNWNIEEEKMISWYEKLLNQSRMERANSEREAEH